MSNCAGQTPVSGYQGPSCPHNNCGNCYSVTNQGGMDGGSVGGVGNTVMIQIIDSCPSQNAFNYCKTDIAENQRCEAMGVNALDIDQAAYQSLTGQPFGSVSTVRDLYEILLTLPGSQSEHRDQAGILPRPVKHPQLFPWLFSSWRQ